MIGEAAASSLFLLILAVDEPLIRMPVNDYPEWKWNIQKNIKK
ncbi:hypothetical protein [Oceanobacillus massiliensis]|nr:hypothetical protein [Oceanobacillus massiliensis]